MAVDSIGAAIRWLDAYRGKSLDIADMYLANAVLDCRCSGTTLTGKSAIEQYWIERFSEKPAQSLVDLQQGVGSTVVVTYLIKNETVRAILKFDKTSAKIAWQRCG